MRQRKGETDEDRQARYRLEDMNNEAKCQRGIELGAVLRRRRYAALPEPQYQAFVIGAEQQRAGAEAMLADAGLTVSRDSIERVRQGITDELQIIADIRADTDSSAFAGPDPQEDLFAE